MKIAHVGTAHPARNNEVHPGIAYGTLTTILEKRMLPLNIETTLGVFALCVIAMGLGYLWGWIDGAKIKRMDDKVIAILRRHHGG